MVHFSRYREYWVCRKLSKMIVVKVTRPYVRSRSVTGCSYCITSSAVPAHHSSK
jgi:hypothetical protein